MPFQMAGEVMQKKAQKKRLFRALSSYFFFLAAFFAAFFGADFLAAFLAAFFGAAFLAAFFGAAFFATFFAMVFWLLNYLLRSNEKLLTQEKYYDFILLTRLC